MAALVVAFAGLAVEASAGPSCNTKGGAARPKAAAAQPAKQVVASKPVVAEAPAAATPAVEKKVSAVKVETPAVLQQAAAIEAAPEYVSVSGIAARLAALSANVRQSGGNGGSGE